MKVVDGLTVGDRAAFGELYDRHVKPAYSLARTSASTSGVVEDLTEGLAQEVFPDLRQPGALRLIAWRLRRVIDGRCAPPRGRRGAPGEHPP
ncbi:hypothetical protein ACRAKI_12520 [Saccharothrix isguenensis]